MQRVVRLSFVGLLAIAGASFATACGDKVTVPPAQSDSTVHSVTVSPPSAQLKIGDKFQFGASVDAGQGVARTVTWSSSNTAVATVDQTGLVTAVASGNASIVAKSTAAPDVSGAASVTVAEVVQASVTLGNIMQTVCSPTGVCSSIPATLTNVAGQLDVTVNLDQGTQKVSKVDLIMSCNGKDTVVATQTLSTADVAPLTEDAAAPLQFSFNTASFNPTTGAVAFKNGTCTLKAAATTTQGQQVASTTENITLNNVDVVSATMTTTPATGQVKTATDASGLVWNAGAVNVTAVPVIYTAGATAASATISLVNADTASVPKDTAWSGSAGSVTAIPGFNVSNTAIATQTISSPSAGVFTATFPKDQSATGVDSLSVPFLGVVVNTVSSTGNPGPSAVVSLSNIIRLDNLPPNKTPVVFKPNTQNTLGGWVGTNFVFANAIIAVVGTDTVSLNTLDYGGVDKVTVTTQSRPTGSGSFATFTSVTSLGETASGSSLDLRVQVCDALGNCATTGTLTQFGVDLTPPTATENGLTDKQVFHIGSTIPTADTVHITDTASTVGATASGGAGVLVRLQALKPSGSTGSATTCLMPVKSSACSADSLVVLNTTDGSFALPAGATTSGEFTLTKTAVDQAGNKSATITVAYYVDLAAPTVSGGVSIPASVTGSSTFTSTATDNMDVKAGNGYLQYAAGKFLETGSASPTGVTFDNALTRSAAITVDLTQTFFRSLTTAAGTAGTAPTNIGIRALDAAGNLSSPNVVAIPSANVAAGATIPNTGGTGITAFTLTIDSAAVAATHTVNLKTTLTPVDAVNGGSPFAQVCYYYAAPDGAEGGFGGTSGANTGDLVKIGCTSSLVVTNGPRTLSYTMPWTVPASLASTSLTIYAVGVTSATDALISSSVGLTVNAVPTP